MSHSFAIIAVFAKFGYAGNRSLFSIRCTLPPTINPPKQSFSPFETYYKRGSMRHTSRTSDSARKTTGTSDQNLTSNLESSKVSPDGCPVACCLRALQEKEIWRKNREWS